jgi:hypothetical protein
VHLGGIFSFLNFETFYHVIIVILG